jgi:mono/diheme cytochrome c family protein
MRNFLVGMFFAAVVILVGTYLFFKRGYVSTEADQAPSAFESNLAMSAMDASIDRHAPDLKNPVQPTDENLAEGAKIYLNNCAGCHGMPSSPDSQFGRSFYPPVPQFFKDAPDMSDNQNFYVIQHGIRWTGMPAWGRTLSEQQIWTVVTFISRVNKLPPSALKVFEPPPPTAPAPALGVATAPPSR